MFKTCNPPSSRPRIAEAISIIRANLLKGEQTSTIVLPPRYGKSDLQRLASIEFVETELVTVSVLLSPWVFLRDQLILPEKIAEMRKRSMQGVELFVPTIIAARLDGSIHPKFFEDSPRRHFFSMTIGAAREPASKTILKDAARYCRDVLRKPSLVFIDESQTVAEPGGWGVIARDLVDSGAHVVLVTGTPNRADNIAPFGFRVKEKARVTDQKYWKRAGFDNDGDAIVEEWGADRVTYELDADLNVTLNEAWTQGIMAQLQVRWGTCKWGSQNISDITDKRDARLALSEAVRDQEFQKEMAELFVTDIAIRRQTRPNSAGIVFVGNDRVEDEGKDQHAQEIKTYIERQWRIQFGAAPIVRIATLDVKGLGKRAKTIIEQFAEGYGDVIIVKQMGGVGLDVQRLKTVLDLSTVRTLSNTTQRWLRIATQWDSVKFGTLILPNDPITQELYKTIIKDQGGEFSVMEDDVYLRTKKVVAGEDEEDEEEITDVGRAGATDQSGSTIDRVTDEDVEKILRKSPFLIDRLSRVEIAQLIASGTFDASSGEAHVAEELREESVLIVDDECEELRVSINNKANERAQLEAPYIKGNGIEFVKCRSKWIAKAKSAGGIKCELGDCKDVAKLKMAEAFLTAHLT